jgi:F5/8 type C domain/Putative Ig domain
VDQEDALVYPDDLYDEWHPTNAGYNKMANVWFDALSSFLPVCRVVALDITTLPVTAAFVGQSYRYDVDATGSPTPAYTLTACPAGMTIDSATGLIQWTPSAPGDYPVTVQASNGIGTPATQTFTLAVVLVTNVIPQTNWSLKYADSQETTCEDGAAVNAFDGDNGTFWHTQWCGGNPPPPHEIQIDLGGSYSMDGFRYLPGQDGGINGTIAKYEFYISADGVNWGSPVATGIFTNTTSEKEVRFAAAAGRYVRLRALSEVNGKPWTSMAEINVLGSL